MDHHTRGVAASTAERLGILDRLGMNSQTGRLALAIVWPPVMVAVIYGTVGRLGFFPTDEGLDLSYGYRMLMGQVPHRDFVSPRPVGSALLHLIDFAIPGPLFEVSRFIDLCEFVAYTIAFAWLIYALAPWRWTIVMMAAAAAAVLININRFPLMAWYTVDGLLLIGIGFLLVRRGVMLHTWRWIAAGFVLLGVAALTKQSFVPAVALGWFLLKPRLAGASWPARLRDLIVTGAYGAAPGILYVALIAVLGGFHDMKAQLLGVPPIFVALLLNAWLPGHDLIALVALTALSTAVGFSAAPKIAASAWSLIPRILLTLLVLGVVVIDQLGLKSDGWGTRLFWMAIAFWVARCLTVRSFDEVGLALIGVAWMASLSYSFFYPNLVGGSLAIYLVHRAWSGTTWPEVRWARLAPAGAGLAALAVMSGVFGVTRTQDVYLDRPAGQLTASLGSLSPAFGSIRTNRGTAAYLEQMKACIDRYPARYVAILPENAGLYPGLSLTNPFPIDWIWTYDVHGSETRIAATANDLNRSGDYLVLFQTADDSRIIQGGLLPDATPNSPIYAFTPLPSEIYTRLNGTKTTCGSFLVVYAPPA